jgi:hypothetical protein
VGNIAPAAPFRKPVELPKALQGLAKSGILLRPHQRFQLTVNYMSMSKNDAPDSDDHRQIREEVYTH